MIEIVSRTWGRPAILSSVLRWLIRLASVLATAALAYGWGDFATDPGPLEALVLIALTIVLIAALRRLYRPEGPAAFEWDGEPPRRAPGEPAPAREQSPPPPPHPASVPRRGPRSSGSLWSSEDRDG